MSGVIAGKTRGVPSPTVQPTDDLLDDITILSNSISASTQNNRNPTAQEKEDFLQGLLLVLQDEDSGTLLTDLGFTVKIGVDVSGKRFAYIVNEFTSGTERSWGAYLIDLDNPKSYVFKVNHTRSDIDTEFIALDCWRKVQGGVVIFSGVHRNVDVEGESYTANTAANTESLFHEACKLFIDAGLPQMSIHGYADASAPDEDIILSPSIGVETPSHFMLVDYLRAQDFIVRTKWEGWSILLGNTNIQGIYSAEKETVYTHIELSNTTRTTPSLREKAVTSLTKSCYDTLAQLNDDILRTKVVRLTGDQDIAGNKNFLQATDFADDTTGLRIFQRYYRDGVQVGALDNNASGVRLRALTNSLQLRNENNTGLDITSDNNIVVGSGVNEIQLNSKKITDLADGTEPNDAVNKSQLDAMSGGGGALFTRTAVDDDYEILPTDEYIAVVGFPEEGD